MMTSYRSWDVNLFVSDHDALGRTPCEAAARGCCVVASVRHGGLPEVLTNGFNGILRENQDPRLLAEDIHALLDDEPRMERYRSNYLKVLRERHSLEASLAFLKEQFVGAG